MVAAKSDPARFDGVQTVRYRAGKDNSVLRLALYEEWRTKCYWCDMPMDFNGLEIDHILPRTATKARLTELVEQLSPRRLDHYDVDDPYNLAPICGTCNRKKGALDLTRVAVVASHLDRAHRLRTNVIRRVEAFPAAGTVTKAFVTAIEADPANPKARTAIEEHAPRLVQKIALMDPAIADGYLLTRPVCVDDPDRRHMWDVRVTLDSAGRTSLHVLEDVCGGRLERLLFDPLFSLEESIVSAFQSQLEDVDVPGGSPDVGIPTASIEVVIDKVRLTRDGATFEFGFWGRFDADLTAAVIVPSEDGSSIDEEQGYDMVEGTATFAVWWSAADDVFESGDCLISVSRSAPEILGVRAAGDWLMEDYLE